MHVYAMSSLISKTLPPYSPPYLLDDTTIIVLISALRETRCADTLESFYDQERGREWGVGGGGVGGLLSPSASTFSLPHRNFLLQAKFPSRVNIGLVQQNAETGESLNLSLLSANFIFCFLLFTITLLFLTQIRIVRKSIAGKKKKKVRRMR
jgi:hypothetical protein